jgi:hypothetical protein
LFSLNCLTPAKSLEVAEADVGAAKPDVSEEMIVKLHEAMPGAACLDRLSPVAEETHDQANSGV